MQREAPHPLVYAPDVDKLRENVPGGALGVTLDAGHKLQRGLTKLGCFRRRDDARDMHEPLPAVARDDFIREVLGRRGVGCCAHLPSSLRGDYRLSYLRRAWRRLAHPISR